MVYSVYMYLYMKICFAVYGIWHIVCVIWYTVYGIWYAPEKNPTNHGFLESTLSWG